MADVRTDPTRAIDARTEPVATTEMEIASDSRDGQTLRFHFRCFARWLARVQTRRPGAS